MLICYNATINIIFHKNMENSELINALYSDELVYSDCCWLTSHNAYTYDWKVYSQQHLNIGESFNYGVRSFMLDLHDYQNTVALCHDSCTTTYYLQKPGAPLEAEVLFKEIYNLLEVNKLDIITLYLESYVPRLSIDKVIKASGLDLFLLKSKNPNEFDSLLESTNCAWIHYSIYDRLFYCMHDR